MLLLCHKFLLFGLDCGDFLVFSIKQLGIDLLLGSQFFEPLEVSVVVRVFGRLFGLSLLIESFDSSRGFASLAFAILVEIIFDHHDAVTPISDPLPDIFKRCDARDVVVVFVPLHLTARGPGQLVEPVTPAIYVLFDGAREVELSTFEDRRFKADTGTTSSIVVRKALFPGAQGTDATPTADFVADSALLGEHLIRKFDARGEELARIVHLIIIVGVLVDCAAVC